MPSVPNGVEQKKEHREKKSETGTELTRNQTNNISLHNVHTATYNVSPPKLLQCMH